MTAIPPLYSRNTLNLVDLASAEESLMAIFPINTMVEWVKGHFEENYWDYKQDLNE
jgi:hypothetical protein